MRFAGDRMHGGSVSAPEEVYAPSESPAPAPVAEKRPNSVGGRLWLMARVALGVAAVVGTSLAVAASAHRYALTSPRFSVKNLIVSGSTRFHEAEVREIAGIQAGSNLFSLDPRVVEQRLLQNPWIAQARVNRKLPSTLEVELKQRDATAIAAVGERLYLASKEGEPFKQVEGSDPIDLPVVTGLHAENLQRDRSRELDRLGVALEVLRQYARLGMSRVYAAQEVHVGDAGQITLTVGKEGVVLALSTKGLRQRLLMAERVIQETRQGGRLPGVVFADNQAHPERVVVRMR
ncbi:MAG TPA: FtsQ-type POTRA domain-containing protein [Polyangiaceae bacterium]|nr:FtsQ-type POTRA domain-containing protein [Polyangiaceae bacterium]